MIKHGSQLYMFEQFIEWSMLCIAILQITIPPIKETGWPRIEQLVLPRTMHITHNQKQMDKMARQAIR